NIYMCLFSLFIVGWPFLVFQQNIPLLVVVAFVNGAVFVAVVYSLHSSDMDYFKGFANIAAYWMSGCGNLTLAYIFALLAYYYLGAIKLTVLGMFKGKTYVEQAWSGTVAKHIR